MPVREMKEFQEILQLAEEKLAEEKKAAEEQTRQGVLAMAPGDNVHAGLLDNIDGRLPRSCSDVAVMPLYFVSRRRRRRRRL